MKQKNKPLHYHTKLYELEDIFVVFDSFSMAFQINLSIVILVSFFVSGFLRSCVQLSVRRKNVPSR